MDKMKNCNCTYKTFGILIPSLNEGIYPEYLPPKNMIYIYKRSNGGLYYYDQYGREFPIDNLSLEDKEKLDMLETDGDDIIVTHTFK